MRKLLLTTALESGALGDANISLEEEALMVSEAQDDAAEVSTDLAEAERLIEVTDALEDLAVVADDIEEATPTELQLIETVGQAAVAGTDVEPEEIVPAMEGFKGGRIATEGIRDRARSIWEQIQRYLKQIWEKIEGFFYKLFGTVPSLRKRVAALRDRVDSKQGMKSEAKTVDIPGATYLSISGTPIKNDAALTKGLNALHEAAKFVYGGYSDSIATRGEIIADALNKFDIKEAESAAITLRDKLAAAKAPALPGGGTSDKTRFPGFDTKIGPALLGNHSLASKIFTDSTDTTVLGSLDKFRRAGVELITTQEKPKAHTGKAEYSLMSMSAMNSALDNLDKILDLVEEYRRGKRSKDIAKSRDSIKASSTKATKSMDNAKTGDEEARATVAYYRAMINFNAAYARWVQQPAVPFSGSALSTVRATLALIEKNLVTYK